MNIFLLLNGTEVVHTSWTGLPGYAATVEQAAKAYKKNGLVFDRVVTLPYRSMTAILSGFETAMFNAWDPAP